MPEGFNHIVRVIDKDLNGSLKVTYALIRMKGINKRLASIILKKADIDKNLRLGFLSEEDVKKIENIIRNPLDSELPKWLLNHQKDVETGKDIHLMTSNLDLSLKSDIEKMRYIKSWRGYRHGYGLKVRGQRTKTTGRKGKTTGVKKRSRGAR